LVSNEEVAQREVCERFGVPWHAAPADMKVGITWNVKSGIQPINGLRHPPEGDTSGWYIWAGEGDPPKDPQAFVPLHVGHLAEWCPQVVKFLGLPPGSRFLIASGYEDVWEDPTLLEV